MLDKHVIQGIIIPAVLIISLIPVIYAIPSTATTNVEMECYKNHIHILVKSKPKISILSVIRKIEARINIPYVEKPQKTSKNVLLERKYSME